MENTNQPVKKGQVRQWAIVNSAANGLTFRVVLMPGEESTPEVSRQVARGRNDVAGKYLKQGEHPSVVNESRSEYTTAPEEFVQSHSVLIEEARKPRPRTSGKMLESFQLRVVVDPERDVLQVEKRGGTSACDVCVVTKAVERAVKPRFRRWKTATIQTQWYSTYVRFTDSKGFQHTYRAKLEGDLLIARRLYDNQVQVKPVDQLVTFNLDY